MKKLAIIGCGGIGTYHFEHFLNFKDIELAGFCDLIIERAENFAKRAGTGKAFICYEEMLDEIKPDMVFVCIPPYKHGDVEFALIDRGIHFFVEKPVTLDLDLAIEIRDKIDEKNLITAVGFQCRYDNINEPVFDFLKNNRVLVAEGSRVGDIPGVAWWRDKTLSGGQLVEQTVHQMDIYRYFLGEAESVYSVAGRGHITQAECPGYDSDDFSTTLIKFKSGIVATMMTGCYSKNGASWDSKITLGTRTARLDYRLVTSTTVFGLDDQSKAGEVEGTIKGDGTQRRNENEIGYKVNSNIDFGTVCDRTFIDAVISGDRSKIRSPYHDAVKTLALVLACNESMETGLPVKIYI